MLQNEEIELVYHNVLTMVEEKFGFQQSEFLKDEGAVQDNLGEG